MLNLISLSYLNISRVRHVVVCSIRVPYKSCIFSKKSIMLQTLKIVQRMTPEHVTNTQGRQVGISDR
jgi:hypothetical protein